MRSWILPLVLGLLLWSLAGWAAHPRELWDVPFFWAIWAIAVLVAGALALAHPGHALRDTALLFFPILIVLAVTGLLSGRGASLLPLGLIVIVVLALPALALATLPRPRTDR